MLDTLQARAGTIVDAGSDLIQNARAQSLQAGRQVNQYVHKNTWAAVGVAAGVGMLAGILLGRKVYKQSGNNA
jgi:ElaB/YqjD/DUF883 family membrane-anchored ribosome-binding protein